jgi:hypothetical protein
MKIQQGFIRPYSSVLAAIFRGMNEKPFLLKNENLFWK